MWRANTLSSQVVKCQHTCVISVWKQRWGHPLVTHLLMCLCDAQLSCRWNSQHMVKVVMVADMFRQHNYLLRFSKNKMVKINMQHQVKTLHTLRNISLKQLWHYNITYLWIHMGHESVVQQSMFDSRLLALILCRLSRSLCSIIRSESQLLQWIGLYCNLRPRERLPSASQSHAEGPDKVFDDLWMRTGSPPG